MEARQVGKGTLGAIVCVYATVACSWAMTPSGLGGAVGRAEAFGVGVGASIEGIWIPLFLMAGLVVTIWAALMSRISAFVARLICAALIAGIGLVGLSEYFGSAAAAELETPPAVHGAVEAGE
jgi:hypothetical protein